MTFRITKQMVQRQWEFCKELLPATSGHTWKLDYYKVPGNPYCWSLVIREDKSGAETSLYHERFTHAEMRAFFFGMRHNIDYIKHFCGGGYDE